MFCAAPFAFFTPHPVSVPAGVVVHALGVGVDATASVTFQTDGTTTWSATPSNAGSTGVPPAPWCPAPGGAYWIKFDMTSPLSIPGTWLALTSARTITATTTSGSTSTVYSVSIASDAAGANVLATGSITLSGTKA